MEHDGGVILAQMGRKGMKRGEGSGRDSLQQVLGPEPPAQVV